MNFISIILSIAFLSFLSSTLSNTGKLIDKRTKWVLTKLGFWVIFINIIILSLLFLQEYLNQGALKTKELEAETKQHKRDSIQKRDYDAALYIIKNKFDTSNFKTAKVISGTLGKYGYMLDSTKELLAKLIRDSSKTKVMSSEAPILTLCNEGGFILSPILDRKSIGKLRICSMDASSTGFEINCRISVAFSSKPEVVYNLDSFNLIEKDLRIAKNEYFESQLHFDSPITYEVIYIYLKGIYKNSDESMSFPLDVIYRYHSGSNRLTLILGNHRKRVISNILKSPTPYLKF